MSVDAKQVCKGALGPLPPDTIRLSNELAEVLGGSLSDVHSGTNISEPQFRRLIQHDPLSNYRVIAFVTHGLLAGELAQDTDAEPALVLSPPAGCEFKSTDEDGLLTASEVSELSLDANWVLLLACNTASPEGIPGAEPLSGLARAFLYAGARALLVSHWSVDAVSTAKFIDLVFRQPEGLGRAARLRAARISMRATQENGSFEYDHPALWSAFVLIGDGL
jgi:CHAT domain-containing protein